MLDDATLAVPSPDGSRLAFTKAGETELWVSDSQGENARRLTVAEPDTYFREVDWTPDGRRLSWVRVREGAGSDLQTCDRDGGPAVSVFSDSRLRIGRWTPDGAVILSMVEPPPNDASQNLWELRVDARGLRAQGRPRRITNWVGTSFIHLSLTADGRRLVFGKAKAVADLHLADLVRNGDALANLRRFTAADRTSWPSAWTADSRALVFHSDRNGDYDLYRQDVSSSSPELLAGGAGEQSAGQFSPGQDALLYLDWAAGRQDTVRLMSAPSTGDAPRPLFSTPDHSLFRQREYVARGRLHTNVYPSFRCPAGGSAECVAAEVQQGQVVFSAFDASSGARREIAKTGSAPRSTFWDLSPDGARLAFGRQGGARGNRGFLRIISVRDGAIWEFTRTLRIPADLCCAAPGAASAVTPERVRWDGAGWSADGKSLFMVLNLSTGSRILHLNLDGKPAELYRTISWVDRPLASPDGRRLAFSEITYDSNVWMLENFR